ncbi:winged helix-turn-helix domain-containing protein [Pontibacter sp. G13]|uniref:winged helix-turn-helix domain-containing protein n=1 Tax=Pontibacter sp. G13 TaxID=3074898 RepID=UPI00288B384F|nr:winged helix-turn-helix domain-containing protein [Pontibacter sp. G13]WNJ17154.1 winged helix-turn-helix domain-containing protein [Pontibacter sp. G13]
MRSPVLAKADPHVSVSMRLIGHEVMRRCGDDASRVLPIRQEGNRYRISFESDFAFDPAHLVGAVDSIIAHTQLAENYLVEVIACKSQEVVYGYEISTALSRNLIPCSGRLQPKACYELHILLFDQMEESQGLPIGKVGFPLMLILAVGGGIYWFRRQPAKAPESHLIEFGAFTFDPRTSLLQTPAGEEELTGKEAELLSLLLGHINATVERQEILSTVWGDEGNYVGRTLDVFISKLRKRLASDPLVKITNIRGVGYRLVVE